MPNKDIAAEAAAALGLMTGAIVLDGPVKSAAMATDSAMMELRLDPGDSPDMNIILAAGSFENALRITTDTFTGIALGSGTQPLYGRMVQEIHAKGGKGFLVCRPARGIWPDAMAPVSPEEAMEKPSGRCFPLYHYARAVAMDYDKDDPSMQDMDGFCQANPDILVKHPIGGDTIMFFGWNEEAGAKTSFCATLWDFKVPWRVMPNPDGSDTILRADVLRQTDALFNAWESASMEGGVR